MWKTFEVGKLGGIGGVEISGPSIYICPFGEPTDVHQPSLQTPSGLLVGPLILQAYFSPISPILGKCKIVTNR